MCRGPETNGAVVDFCRDTRVQRIDLFLPFRRGDRAHQQQRIGIAVVTHGRVLDLCPMLRKPRGRHHRRDPAVADAAGAVERDIRVTTDDDRDRALHGTRLGIHRGAVVELAVELDEVAVSAPERTHECDVLFGATATPVPRHVHRRGLFA